MLYDEFHFVIFRLLGQGGKKRIVEIKFLLSFAEAKFLSKKAVGMTVDPTHMLKNSSHKKKAITTCKKKYFNCHKIGYYRKNYKYPDYRLFNKKKKWQ